MFVAKKALIITVSSSTKDRSIAPIPNVKVNRQQLSVLFEQNEISYETVEEPTLTQFGESLIDFLDSNTNDDTILVYYAGHGLRDNKDRKVYLETKDSIKNKVSSTSYNINVFVDTIKKYKNIKRRIIIIDSCFSGAAHSMGNHDDEWLNVLKCKGVYILTATNSFEEAYFPEDETKPTYFTGVLLDILTNGLEDTTKEDICLKDLFDELNNKLNQINESIGLRVILPMPEQTTSMTVQDFPFWRNNSYKRPDNTKSPKDKIDKESFDNKQHEPSQSKTETVLSDNGSTGENNDSEQHSNKTDTASLYEEDKLKPKDNKLSKKISTGIILAMLVGLLVYFIWPPTAKLPNYNGDTLVKVDPYEDGVNGVFKVKEGTKKIAAHCFSNCHNLKEIVLPTTIETIERRAFEECVNLENIRLHEHIIYIGEGAFMKCERLKSLNIPLSLTSIDINPFCGCNNLKVIVPQNHELFYEYDGYLINKKNKYFGFIHRKTRKYCNTK